MEDNQKLRLFTAIELPSEWRETLGKLRGDLERAAPAELKWVRPDLMHLTLVFLGSQKEEALAEIVGACRTAASESTTFQLRMGKAGCFGSPHRLQVIWLGLSEVPEGLAHLHRSLAGCLSERAIALDTRPLVPHITMARARRSMDAAASLRAHSALQGLAVPRTATAAVSEFVLMQSRLSRLGAEYEVVERLELGVGRRR